MTKKKKYDIKKDLTHQSQTKAGVRDGHCLTPEAMRIILRELRKLGAKKVLQIGTYNGYAVINIHNQMPNTEIWTVDYIPEKPGNYNVCLLRRGHSRDENMKRHENLQRYLNEENIDNIYLYINGSDEFFKQNKETFDASIVHGDHAFEVASRDLQNSLKCVKPGGLIFMIPTADKNHMERNTVGVFWGYEGEKKYFDSKEGVGIIYVKD